jgi:asparagine synthase (glutamine-hydrolysing)
MDRPTLRPLQVPERLRHSPIEALTSIMWGLDPFAPALPKGPFDSPRDELEALLLTHLERQPCLVTFSGGRDSSSILALADHVARKHGLPRPVPVTNRFPEADDTDESEWQERVVAHLGLDDWVRLEWTDELDLVGPYAAGVLLRHGALMPHNTHFIAPMTERAAGGTLLTGVGGDELFAGRDRPVAHRVVFARKRVRVRQLPQLVHELSPRPWRARRSAQELPFREFGWLWPDVGRYVAREYARSLQSLPLAWDRMIEHYWGSRTVQAVQASLRAVGSDHDGDVASPFSHPRVLAAFAHHTGSVGPQGRTRALRALVGDLLPEWLTGRSTKAQFDEPFYSTHSRAFLERWDGRGVDERLVDVEGFRREWASGHASANASTLLQRAWVAEQRDRLSAGAQRGD